LAFFVASLPAGNSGGCPHHSHPTVHHGRQNKYTFIYKGKNIALLPLTPAEIVQHEKELAEKKKNDQDKESSKTPNEPSSNIKGEVLFALKSVLTSNDESRYALTCISPICPLSPAPSALPFVGTNLLQEEDEFPAGRPLWQPSLRRIGRQDERLLLEPSLLSTAVGDDLLQSRTTSIQEREDDEDITPSPTSQGVEGDQHECPSHLSRGGGPVQLKLEPISGSRTSLP
jgi:hypothetical protein